MESSRQSTTRLLALRLTLSPSLHQLLLLLTKVPAAQSQGKEVVLVQVVEDLIPHLARQLVKTPSVRDLPRAANVLETVSLRKPLLLQLLHLTSQRS